MERVLMSEKSREDISGVSFVPCQIGKLLSRSDNRAGCFAYIILNWTNLLLTGNRSCHTSDSICYRTRKQSF